MHILDSYSVFVTRYLRECRDFYVRWFGYEVAFEATWFILLMLPGESPNTIAFMAPDHPSSPPGPEAFEGEGMFLTFQVANAAAVYHRLLAEGATFVYELRDEPWGQRRFGLRDPAGTLIDVVEQTEPDPGFWDPYLQPSPQPA